MKLRLPLYLLATIAAPAASAYTNSEWTDSITDSISLDSYETIDISGKATPLDGGAIYITEDSVALTGSGGVRFANNAAVWGGAIYFDFDPYHPVFDESRTLTFSGNGSISFTGNTASGGGAAVYSGFNTVFANNGDIEFSGNTDTLTTGAALVTSLGLSFSGNGDVRFRGNFNKEDMCLRGLYSRSGPVTLSATTGKSITFYDSAYISVDGGARLNAPYTDGAGKTATAAGAIVFTGEHTEQDLAAAFHANGLADGPTEAQIKASRTSRIINNANDTTLEAGSLVIKDGAELKIKGAGMSNGNLTVLRSTSTPGGTKVILENGGHLEAYATFKKGTALRLKGGNRITGALTFESGAGLCFVLGGDKETPLLSTNATIIQKGALNITIDTHGEGDWHYALVSTTYFDTVRWTNEFVTVTGADFDQLHWSVGEDNLYHLSYGGTEIPEEEPEPDPVNPDDPISSTPDSLTWSNAEGNGIWSANAKNWQDNGTGYPHTDGLAVYFGNAGAGTVTLQGRLAPAAVTVDSAADYTFTGDGSLCGGMRLTKQGKGTLTLNNTNSYSGGTTISAGRIVATGAESFGSGGIAVRNATLDLGHQAVRNTVSISGTSAITNGTAYAGTAILTKGGTLKLSGNLTGTLILGGGTLDLTGVKDLPGLRLGTVKTTASLTTIVVNNPEVCQPDTEYTLMSVAEDSSIDTSALKLAGVEDAALEMKGDKLVLLITGGQEEEPTEPVVPEVQPPALDPETEAHLRAGMVYTTLMGAQITGNISAMDTLRSAMGNARHTSTGEIRYSILATGAYCSTSGKGDAPGYERSGAGALLVAERAFSTHFSGGLAAGCEYAKATADGYGDWTSTDSRMTAYVLYTGNAWQSGTAIGLGLHRYEVDRNADGQTATTSPDGMSLNFMQEISYVVPWHGDKRLEPFLRVDSSSNKINACSETGPGALYMEGQDAWATHVTLGLRCAGSLDLGGAFKPASFTLEAGLTKSIGAESDMLTVRMDSDRTHGLELNPASRGRWGASFSGGIAIPLKEHHTISAGAGAKIRMQGGDTEFNANAGYSYSF